MNIPLMSRGFRCKFSLCCGLYPAIPNVCTDARSSKRVTTPEASFTMLVALKLQNRMPFFHFPQNIFCCFASSFRSLVCFFYELIVINVYQVYSVKFREWLCREIKRIRLEITLLFVRNRKLLCINLIHGL